MSEEQKRAGLLLRTAAKLLDFILIAAVIEIIPRAGYFAGLAYLLLGDGLMEGRSIGKKLIRIRVISSESASPCSFKDSILRNSTFAAGYILLMIPWVGWLLGWTLLILISAFEFIVLLGSKDSARIGDEIAKTAVIET